MSLDEYQRKRKFHSNDKTPEPKGDAPIKPNSSELFFCIHKHAATRLHYDLRLEFNGSLKSWAVPKGPSLNPLDLRLAVFVEDHPLDYGTFEGLIPEGHYGAGATLVWDIGWFRERSSQTREQSEKALQKGLERGHITIVLFGKKLRGEFALLRTKNTKSWLLTKKRDEYTSYEDVLQNDRSVLSGLTIEELEKKEGPFLSNERIDAKNARRTKTYAPKDKDLAGKKASLLTSKSLKPMLYTLMRAPNLEADWKFSVDYHGYRILLRKEDGRVEILGNDPTRLALTFKELLKKLISLPVSAVFEASIIVKNPEGSVSRQALLEYRQKKSGDAYLILEDILELKGKSLKSFGFSERRNALADLKSEDPGIQIIEIYATEQEAIAAAKVLGLEKIKAHHNNGIYQTGLSTAFVSIPVSEDREITILPIEEPESAGKDFVATNNFTIDKQSKTKIKLKDGPILTHLSKVLWPKSQTTKGDLIEYYAAVASVMVPYLKDRPISLNRHPQGIEGKGFYQKDFGGYRPPWFESVMVESSHKGFINFCLCQDERSLLYIANLCCIEIHPWLSKKDALDCPTYLAIDLDPDDSNTFDQVITTAQHVYQVLSEIKVHSFVKTSGATGLHIYVPLVVKHDYDRVRQVAEKIASLVHERVPEFTSIVRNKGQRRGRIYIDYMQNVRGQTLVSPYSVRPVPARTVSAPLRWSEVNKGLDPSQFHMDNMIARLEKVGDLWAGMWERAYALEELEKNLGIEG